LLGVAKALLLLWGDSNCCDLKTKPQRLLLLLWTF
jgi:hypothetical protein